MPRFEVTITDKVDVKAKVTVEAESQQEASAKGKQATRCALLAAGEMLEVCREALAFFDTQGLPGLWSRSKWLRRRLEDVITKAEGRDPPAT